jgi:ribose 5-phosphate isomerase B
MCLGADLLGEDQIERMIKTWLVTEFEGGRHTRREAKLAAYEKGADTEKK